MNVFLGMFSSFSTGNSIIFTFRHKKDYIENEFSISFQGITVLISNSQLQFENKSYFKFHNYLFLGMNIYNALETDIYDVINGLFFIDQGLIGFLPKILFVLGLNFFFSPVIKKKNSKISITDMNFMTAVYTIKSKHDISIFIKKLFNPDSLLINGLQNECSICFRKESSFIINSCKHQYCTLCFVEGILNEIDFCFYCKKPY